jgi:CO/xanthine dehydrogenase Mo-binding subunit
MSADGVGASVHRVGGHKRVTGAQEYLADIRQPNVLHVKLITLDVARARILAIDTTAAAQVPGVHIVMTAADLPQPVPRFGPQFQDRPVLAVGETKYHGEPVAAVAAETKDAAEAAARMVVVEHELLPGVFSVASALDPDAPLVQEPELRPDDPLASTNILREHHFGWGDFDTSAADLVVENTYAFPIVTHFAIEPHGFMAAPDGDGIVIWSAIQHPYLLQKMMAKLLDMPLASVRILAPDPGGAFGGKQNAKLEPLLAFMALRTGRPVRLILTLEETFQAVRRASAEITIRTGFVEDGTLAFQDIEANFMIGAYVDIADRVVSKSSYLGGGPYRIPAARILARTILSHTTPSTAFRGFGIPQLTWARESNLDEGALALGIDRVEIRLRNLVADGEVFIPDETPADGDWAQSVRKAAELIRWDSPIPTGRGRGLAIGLKSGPTSGLSYSTVRLLADGSSVIYAGTSDMGQGARTVFAQIVSEELGLPIDRISVVMGDTAVVPYDQQTSASRSSVLMGTAVLRACRDIQAQLSAMASRLHGIETSQIVVENGVVRLPKGEATILEVLRAGLGPLGGELVGNGEMRKEGDPDHPLGGSAAFFEFNCTATEVEVDQETGETVIHRYVTVGDVGRAMNPIQVAGQDEGAAIMGLGHTLMEHIILDNSGRIQNLGAIDYLIPTSNDLPVELLSASVENADGPGPYGVKGIAEGGVLPTAPAVAGAVREASGAFIRELPLTPERIWQALQERP